MKGLSILALCFTILLTACVDGIVGKGEIIKREYSFESFEGVDFSLPGNVTFEQGEQYISIRTNKNLFEFFDFEVRNGVLHLSLRDRVAILNYDEMEMVIRNPSLNRFEVDGSGDMVSSKPILVEGDMVLNIDGSGDISIKSLVCRDLNMEIDGSGDMFIEKIVGRKLECNIDGSGDILISGEGEEFEVDIDGSGDVKAGDLRVEDGDVDINGSGNTHVWAEDDLYVRINGSGSVYYKGNPDLKTEVNGSGDVRKQK